MMLKGWSVEPRPAMSTRSVIWSARRNGWRTRSPGAFCATGWQARMPSSSRICRRSVGCRTCTTQRRSQGLRRIVVTVAISARRTRRVTLLRLDDAPEVPVLDEAETSWSEEQVEAVVVRSPGSWRRDDSENRSALLATIASVRFGTARIAAPRLRRRMEPTWATDLSRQARAESRPRPRLGMRSEVDDWA